MSLRGVLGFAEAEAEVGDRDMAMLLYGLRIRTGEMTSNPRDQKMTMTNDQ